MVIGLLGALINNENMGCLALTYSLINLLEMISKELEEEFVYYVFESNPDKEQTRQTAIDLGIKKSNIVSYDVTPLFRARRFIHHIFTGIETLKAFRKCDLFIDMTGGDSFTDIYGQYTFDSETNVKLLVKKMWKPLILGPQTYGPYENMKNKKKAKRTIEKADFVISRDKQSADYIASFSKKSVYVTTDLAFTLPFKNAVLEKTERIKVGINVSGLLISKKTESTQLNNHLKTDYDTYICRVIDWLMKEKKYNIYIIPHVGKDGCEWVKSIYGEKLNYYDPFVNPMAAKETIANMDIFIGSRMHAAIGAFSAGVATIPAAYSRKFGGLFEHLDYKYVVDLCKIETETAINQTIEYIKNYEKLKKTVDLSLKSVNEESIKNRKLLKRMIKKSINKGN